MIYTCTQYHVRRCIPGTETCTIQPSASVFFHKRALEDAIGQTPHQLLTWKPLFDSESEMEQTGMWEKQKN